MPGQPTQAPLRDRRNGSSAVTRPPGLCFHRWVPSSMRSRSTGSRLATTMKSEPVLLNGVTPPRQVLAALRLPRLTSFDGRRVLPTGLPPSGNRHPGPDRDRTMVWRRALVKGPFLTFTVWNGPFQTGAGQGWNGIGSVSWGCEGGVRGGRGGCGPGGPGIRRAPCRRPAPGRCPWPARAWTGRPRRPARSAGTARDTW